MKTHHIKLSALDALNLGRKHGISPSCMHPLLALLEDAPLTRTVIAERTGTKTANITGVMDSLEKGGWVENVSIDNDRRKRAAIPSLKAFEIFNRYIEA